MNKIEIAIAEKIFKAKVIKTKNPYKVRIPAGENVAIGTGNFTTDIRLAFMVVERLKKMDNCCIKIQLDVPIGVWYVTIKGDNYDCTVKAYFGHESLPLAICKAALLSLKYKPKPIEARLKLPNPKGLKKAEKILKKIYNKKPSKKFFEKIEKTKV